MTEATALATAIDGRQEPARVAELARSLGNHVCIRYLRHQQSRPRWRVLPPFTRLSAQAATAPRAVVMDLSLLAWTQSPSLSTPRIDFLGIYPSLQVLGAQVLVALLVAVGFMWNARSAKAAVPSS